jgi:hypothetical protein
MMILYLGKGVTHDDSEAKREVECTV